MTQRIPLKEYLAEDGKSQGKLAKDVQLTQGAISKMALSGREVFVEIDDNGGLSLVEEKRIAPLPAA